MSEHGLTPIQRAAIEIIRREFGNLGLDWEFAVRVAMGESSLGTNLIGDQGTSRGLFQIRDSNAPGGGLSQAFLDAGFTDLNDFAQQAQFVARYVSQNGWGPWSAATRLIQGGTLPTDGTGGGVGANPFGAGGETPEEQRQGQLEADIEFLREQERLARERGDREASQRLNREIVILERQLAAQRSEAALDREFEGEQGALNRDLQLRLQRLSDANRLTETLAGLQAQARDLIVDTIGRDPFRGAVRAQGGVGAGITPLESFRDELRGVASR